MYHKDITIVEMHVPNGPRQHEIYRWLEDTYGSRDVGLARWRHHEKKGDRRNHWDRYVYNSDWKADTTKVRYHFGTPAMATMFKLTWG